MEINDIKNKLVLHKAGSHAYGTNIETSDEDIRGIFVGERKQITTPFYPIREVNVEKEEDCKLYELNTFMKLYCDMNPNIIESLWVDEKDVIEADTAYWYLRDHRHKLLSSRVAFTFSGYAISQLKRINGHNKHMSNPQPEKEPLRSDYLKMVRNFGHDKSMPRDFDILDWDTNCGLVPYGDNLFGLVLGGDKSIVLPNGNFRTVEPLSDLSIQNPRFLIKFCEEEYRREHTTHKQYWDWVNNRNVVRHKMEQDFGYDTKHAMHLVRLLRMGEEILTTGEVLVKRPDAKELLEIRNGAWALEDLLKWATEKDELIRGRLYENTKLPKTPDIKLASKLLIRVQNEFWDTENILK